MPQCMCGYEDCRSCHPEHFETIGGRRVYIRGLEPGEREALREHDPVDDPWFEDPV